MKERTQARILFVENNKSQKEIADITGVSEKTVSRWAVDDNWKAERMAKLMNEQNIRKNGKLMLNNLSEILLDLQTQRNEEAAKDTPDLAKIADLDKLIISYSDGFSKAGKQVTNIIDENKVTLSVYLQVMEDIFNALLSEDSKLHAATLDFQERHIQYIVKKLG